VVKIITWIFDMYGIECFKIGIIDDTSLGGGKCIRTEKKSWNNKFIKLNTKKLKITGP